jgi:antitoxin component of RelBE/YafQ-DinJ toxin-antitoxin module
MTTNTKTLLTVKTDKSLKLAAQEVAGELGFSLGTLVNALLRQFVRTKEVNVSIDEYVPNKKLIADIRKADKEFAEGRLPKPMTLDELFTRLNS